MVDNAVGWTGRWGCLVAGNLARRVMLYISLTPLAINYKEKVVSNHWIFEYLDFILTKVKIYDMWRDIGARVVRSISLRCCRNSYLLFETGLNRLYVRQCSLIVLRHDEHNLFFPKTYGGRVDGRHISFSRDNWSLIELIQTCPSINFFVYEPSFSQLIVWGSRKALRLLALYKAVHFLLFKF